MHAESNNIFGCSVEKITFWRGRRGKYDVDKINSLFQFNDIFQVLFWEDGWWWGGGGGRGGVLSTLRGTTSKDVRILLHTHLHSTMEETARSWAHWCTLCRCNLRYKHEADRQHVTDKIRFLRIFVLFSSPSAQWWEEKGPKNQKDAGRRKALFRFSTENGGVLRLSRMFEVPPQICVLRATEFF